MSVAAGTRIANYEIVALLGAGGMGEVYRACGGAKTAWGRTAPEPVPLFHGSTVSFCCGYNGSR